MQTGDGAARPSRTGAVIAPVRAPASREGKATP